jgi:hypothetical protein
MELGSLPDVPRRTHREDAFIAAGEKHPFQKPATLIVDPQHPALCALIGHTRRVMSNKGVLHFGPFAKYAVAFPKMSRSIFTRANSVVELKMSGEVTAAK